jgi:tape measure domain-containing protein
MAADLEVQIGVDLKELKTGLGKVSEQLEQFSNKTRKDSNSVGESWTSNLSSIVKGFVSIELASKALTGIKNLFLLEERFNALKMPLKNVTEATGDYGVALGFITKLADQTGQDLFVLGDSYKGLYASAKQAGIATSEINNIFKSVVDAGSALKLSNEQVSLSLKAVEQMMNKGTISSEELKGQLGEQLPGAYGMMAKAAQDAGLSVSGSTQELGKLLDEGRLASAEVLPFFAKRMEEAFGKNAEANINTISGSANRLTNELALLITALDDSKVTSFWASMQNGLANMAKDLTYIVKSGSWQDFFSFFGGNRIGIMGKRLGTEMQDALFASKSAADQAKEYSNLNKELAQNVKTSRELLAVGITPNTKAMEELTQKVKRYKELMSGSGSGSAAKPPTIVPPEETKAVKDYTFELALLNLEIKNTQKNIKELNEARELSNLKKLGRTSVSPIPFTMSRSEDASKKDKGLIDQLFGEDLKKSTDNLQSKFEALKGSIKPIISGFSSDLVSFVNKNFYTINEAMTMGTQFLGDVLATGLASIFNRNIKFDFKKMLGQFLSALGDFFFKMATPLIVGGILMNIAVPGSGTAQLISGGKLAALGIGLKGGGMALSSSSVGSSSTSVSTSTGARNIVPFQNPSGFNNTVKFEIQGNTLVGVLNNVNRANG